MTTLDDIKARAEERRRQNTSPALAEALKRVEDAKSDLLKASDALRAACAAADEIALADARERLERKGIKRGGLVLLRRDNHTSGPFYFEGLTIRRTQPRLMAWNQGVNADETRPPEIGHALLAIKADGTASKWPPSHHSYVPIEAHGGALEAYDGPATPTPRR